MMLTSIDNDKQRADVRIISARNTDVTVLPARSRLYKLDPIGVGTTWVESLTSYLCRIADAHSVSIDTLLSKTVLPLINELGQKSGSGFTVHRFYPAWGSALNGTGREPERLLPVLEQLTHTKRLRATTWLAWAQVLSQGNILREPNKTYKGW
jgi:hypothetical protein